MAIKKSVTKFTDKLAKVDDNFSVYMYDNGFMVDIRGRSSTDDWANAKIVANNVDELVSIIREIISAERAD